MVDTGGTQEEHDPGGNRSASKDNTYAGRLKTNVSYNKRLQRNILEIVVEKNMKGKLKSLSMKQVLKEF